MCARHPPPRCDPSLPGGLRLGNRVARSHSGTNGLYANGRARPADDHALLRLRARDRAGSDPHHGASPDGHDVARRDVHTSSSRSGQAWGQPHRCSLRLRRIGHASAVRRRSAACCHAHLVYPAARRAALGSATHSFGTPPTTSAQRSSSHRLIPFGANCRLIDGAHSCARQPSARRQLRPRRQSVGRRPTRPSKRDRTGSGKNISESHARCLRGVNRPRRLIGDGPGSRARGDHRHRHSG